MFNKYMFKKTIILNKLYCNCSNDDKKLIDEVFKKRYGLNFNQYHYRHENQKSVKVDVKYGKYYEKIVLEKLKKYVNNNTNQYNNRYSQLDFWSGENEDNIDIYMEVKTRRGYLDKVNNKFCFKGGKYDSIMMGYNKIEKARELIKNKKSKRVLFLFNLDSNEKQSKLPVGKQNKKLYYWEYQEDDENDFKIRTGGNYSRNQSIRKCIYLQTNKLKRIKKFL